MELTFSYNPSLVAFSGGGKAICYFSPHGHGLYLFSFGLHGGHVLRPFFSCNTRKPRER